MIYFTADHHFGHANILKFQSQQRGGFKDISHMAENYIMKWNEVVNQEDEVYHLGDFGFGKRTRLQWIMHRLNGRKHLIEGNHDRRVKAANLEGWETTQFYKELNIHKKRFVLFHYPIGSWNGMHKGAIHLHGHSHTAYKDVGRMMDVGVDALDGYPISIDNVIKKLDNKTIIKVDHHESRN